MHPGSAAQLFLKRAEPQPSVDDCCGNVAEHWIYYAIIAHTRVLVYFTSVYVLQAICIALSPASFYSVFDSLNNF